MTTLTLDLHPLPGPLPDARVCNRCHCAKPLSDFYTHPTGADGHMRKCKACANAEGRRTYRANVEQRKLYYRAHSLLPHVLAAKAAYAQTPVGKAKAIEARERWAEKHPDRAKARETLNNAVRDGLVSRLPCMVCGEAKSEGHHPVYSLPLAVVWLCKRHHMDAHAVTREGATA